MNWNLNPLPPQPSSPWLVFTHSDDLCSKQHRGATQSPSVLQQTSICASQRPAAVTPDPLWEQLPARPSGQILQANQIYEEPAQHTQSTPRFCVLYEALKFCMKFLYKLISFYRIRIFSPEASFSHTTQRRLSATVFSCSPPPPPHPRWGWSFISGPSTCRQHSVQQTGRLEEARQSVSLRRHRHRVIKPVWHEEILIQHLCGNKKKMFTCSLK